ncbi:AAA family ATPase [Leucobacter sp. gxy201]|uniref:AAA family ATPase n=1 Tax=Leucobacter sp. gxy201 TaxID=2957200 RepID=UPI003DA00982
MLTFDAQPALGEAQAIAREMRIVRAARDRGPGTETAAHEHDLAVLQERLDALLEDPATGPAIREALDARASILRTAVHARRAEVRRAEQRERAERVVAAAAGAGRDLTRSERDRVGQLRDGQREHGAATRDWRAGITTAAERDGVLEALGALRLREAREQLRHGLLLTGQMRQIIAEALPAVLRGEPVLLVGETGGAKTALAEHLSRHGAGLEPELVSGYGDITSAQMLGAHELRAEHGATTSVFVPGPLLRALTEGRPVILDEINAMPAEFLKRLNRILQLRPGDDFGVQEDVGRRVRVAEGFAIIATANEQTPHRYRGLDRLSAELVNRFGANGYRVHYPDAGVRFEDFPAENGLLAAAAVADAHGRLPSTVSVDEIVRVARAAFISQQVFSGAHGAGFGDYVGTEQEIDGRPGLEESVLAPRTLVAVLQKVAGSAGAVTLDRALGRFVESVMHREDRRVLGLILEGQGFSLASR